MLTIEHNPEGDVESGKWDWIHKGIAQRSFKRNFTLSDDIVVQGSRMENGMKAKSLTTIKRTNSTR